MKVESLAAHRARRRWRRWRARWGALVLIGVVVAVIGGVCAARKGSRRGSSGGDDGEAGDPPSGAPEGACAGQLDGSGPTPCPYARAARPIDGPDFARPFEREGNTCLGAGLLRLTSGKVVATDPLVFIEAKPDAIAFAPGRYPVVLSMIDRDVAYALLKIADERPVRWTLALREGEQAPPAGEELGYPVDAGTGAYLDDEAARRISQWGWRLAGRRDRADEPYPLDALYRAGYHDRPWANVCIDPATGANLVAFSSGAGDGVYPVYVGHGASGAPVALVTDFGLGDIGVGRGPTDPQRDDREEPPSR